jgi:hypothetical protein
VVAAAYCPKLVAEEECGRNDDGGGRSMMISLPTRLPRNNASLSTNHFALDAFVAARQKALLLLGACGHQHAARHCVGHTVAPTVLLARIIVRGGLGGGRGC